MFILEVSTMKRSLFLKALEERITTIMKHGGLSTPANKLLSSLYQIAIDQSNNIHELEKIIKDQKKCITQLEDNLIEVNRYFTKGEKS